MDKNLHFWSKKFWKFSLALRLSKKKKVKQFNLFIKKWNFLRVGNIYLLLYRDITVCIFL